MLLPSAPGSSFRLGTQDPNTAPGLEIDDRVVAGGPDPALPVGGGGRSPHLLIERHTPATRATEDGLVYWNVTAHDLDYAGGGTGQTSRLHIHASGGEQRFTWRTQAGFLSSPADVKNQELTVYVRVHGILDPRRAAVTLKIRGGAHTPRDGDLASCVMLTLTPSGSRFGKELVHPLYDYVKLTPRFTAALEDGRWVGMKLTSYAVAGSPARVVNRLYLDVDPFLPGGAPRNDWRLFGEYVDEEGQSTGRYDKLVDWGGWLTSVRTDGVHDVDFTLLSVREIVPPR